jgi:hypothetical protein
MRPSGSGSSVSPSEIGRLDGAKVTQLQLANTEHEWQELKVHGFIEDPNRPQPQSYPVAMVVLGDNVMREINANPVSFFLLTEEARRAGIIVTQEEVDSLLANNIQDVPQQGTEMYELLEMAVRDIV